jgi:hypothetical protein
VFSARRELNMAGESDVVMVQSFCVEVLGGAGEVGVAEVIFSERAALAYLVKRALELGAVLLLADR